MAEEKKNYLTRAGVKKYENELQELKLVKRKEISQKIKEAREQGDLSENAEYDAAKDEQRDVEARIEELEKLLKNVEIVEVVASNDKVGFGCTVTLLDLELGEEMEYTIKGASESNSLAGSISNESPLGKAIIGAKAGDVVDVEAPIGIIQYQVIKITVEEMPEED